MTKPRIKSNILYGLEIDNGLAALVRSQLTRNEIQHRQVWTGTFPPAETELRELQSELTIAQAEQAVFSCMLPFSESVTRWLRTPFSSLKKAHQVFPSLLDIQLPFALSECQYLFLEISQSVEGAQALAAAARNESIQKQIERCQQLDIDPVYLHHEGIALWNQSVFEQPDTDKANPRILCYVGSNRTLLLYGTGRTYSGGGHISMGSQQLCDEENKATWLSRAMLIIRSFPLDTTTSLRWYWTGPGVGDKALLKHFETNLHFQTAPEYATHQNPELFSARAQSEPILRRKKISNLRTNKFSHPLVNRASKNRNTRAAWILLGAGIILLMLNIAWITLIRLRTEQSQEQIRDLAETMAPGTVIPRGMELFKLQQILSERNNSMEAFKAMHEKQQEHLLARIITVCNTEEITAERINLQTGEIEFTGRADNWRAGDHIEKLFQSFGYQTRQTRTETPDGQATSFTVTGVRHVD